MHKLTCTFILGTVARIHLQSEAKEPVSVVLGKNMIVPVLRREGRYDRQQADWQMSYGHGSDWATIRCGTQVACIAWNGREFVKRSGDLPLALVQGARTPARASHYPQNTCSAAL